MKKLIKIETKINKIENGKTIQINQLSKILILQKDQQN